MGRHNSPGNSATDRAAARPRARARRRTVAIATVLVLGVATGAGVAVRNGLLPFGSSCDADAVRLGVVASPAMAPALREAAQYARDKDVTADGRCLDVRVKAEESYKTADSLRSGHARSGYQVWVPDADLWVERAGLGGKNVPLTTAGNVATSPVALGMVPSAAKKLGWPKKRYTWAELARAATTQDELRLGTADPARSASGLLALAKIGASAAKEDGPGSDTRVATTAKILAQRTSDSDTQALETLARDGSGTEQGNPRRNQALIVSEQAAYTHNERANDEADLDLFYPEDGAPELNHPYALMNQADLSTDQSRAALRFMALLTEKSGRGILHKHGFRAGPDEPSSKLVTTAGGRTPQPVMEASGEPPTDRQLDSTLGMWTITVQSARLTTVVDVSGSMARLVPGKDKSRLEVTKSSLLDALPQFTPEDEIGLWQFSTLIDGTRDYEELVPAKRLGDRDARGTTQRERLTKAYTALKPGPGYTGLYDTALAAYKEARSTYVKGKFNAVVILTDGANQDEGSISRSALVAELKRLADPERPVPLITIAVGPDADKEEVQEISEATGGSGYQIDDPAEMQSVILKAIMAAGAN
ncbi:substrate-binding and VWA domain-containing protein [Streptomyces sp. NPDC002851]